MLGIVALCEIPLSSLPGATTPVTVSQDGGALLGFGSIGEAPLCSLALAGVVPPVIPPLTPTQLAEMYGGGAWQKGRKKKKKHDAPLEVMVKVLMEDPKVKESLVSALPKYIQSELPDPGLATLEQLVSKIERASESVRVKVERMYAEQVEEEEDDLWMLLLV
jgi:hypothetical protein